MLGQAGTAPVASDRTVTPPVFMYHSISPSTAPDPHRLRVHPDRLDRHLRLLSRLGLRGVSLGELLRAREEGRARGLSGSPSTTGTPTSSSTPCRCPTSTG